MNSQHDLYLRYNTQDKFYYENCQQYFNGFCISGHLAAHYGNAFVGILNETNKSYFIDPETVAFQAFDLSTFYNDRDEIRSSWNKFLSEHPSEIRDIISSRRLLTPSDFIDQSGNTTQLLSDLVFDTISYQQHLIDDRFDDLRDFLDIRQTSSFIVSPYFCFNSHDDEWYRINHDIISIFNDINLDKQKYSVLCFNKNVLLEERNIEYIINDFIKDDIDGYLLWIDDFIEDMQQTIYYNNLIKLINAISNHNKKIINLYGSYFSILSSYWGMSGHVSGVNSRGFRRIAEIPVSYGPSGGVNPRYYIPQFHKKVVRGQGARYIQQYNELQCNCPICLNNSQVFNPTFDKREGRLIMNQHFLHTRNREIEDVLSQSYIDIFTNIDNVYRRYESDRGFLPINHLNNWHEAITQNIHLIN